nr:hypothetical protein [Candidatus Sigynarchaeota archaeon]
MDSDGSEHSKRPGFFSRARALLQRVPPVVELVLVFGGLVLVGWVWLPPAHATGNRLMEMIGLGVVGFIFMWMLFFSHLVRGKKGGDLGFSTLGEFKLHLHNLAEKKDFWTIILIACALVLPYCLFITNFVPFTTLIPALGPANDLLVKRASPEIVFVIATLEYCLIAAYSGIFFIKIHTLKPALYKYLKYGSPFIIGLFIWAWIQSPELISGYTLEQSIAHFAGYVYWALAQQATVLAYTVTMMADVLARFPIKTQGRKNALNIVFTASMFAVIHFPAWLLSAVAFVMEAVIVSVYINP